MYGTKVFIIEYENRSYNHYAGDVNDKQRGTKDDRCKIL
ncbi:MAG: hypothetical protein A4E28_02418 [Methanocella sp. PtaU1.Bin125]|nr:MAG: hypothetical protein A4E28_02418 [Methanocella sp. PtaU1.Bin125]